MFTLHLAVLFVPYLFSSFFGYYSCMISGLQMLHVLGRLASVIFLATCVTSDDPALYRCQPGTTPQGVTPAPNRETKFLFFLHIIPIFITSFLTGTLLCRRESIFLFLTFNSLCKPNNIIFKIFHFRWSFFSSNLSKKASYKRRPQKDNYWWNFFSSLLESEHFF